MRDPFDPFHPVEVSGHRSEADEMVKDEPLQPFLKGPNIRASVGVETALYNALKCLNTKQSQPLQAK